MKQYLYITFIVFCALLCIRCDDFLDESPDNRQEIETLEDLKELLVSGYSEGSYNFIEWKTDNVTAIPDNTQVPWLTENFQFVPVVSSEAQDTPTYFWSNTYNAIAHANQVLENIGKIPNTNDALRKAIKGEALVIRAYNHFLLANIFCQHYDAATAGTNLGIPYITAPETEVLVSYKRGTLQETYDHIENDLLAGLPLLSDDFHKGSGKYHFNKNAANAFASRFYLYKSDYPKCIEYSNKVLGDGAVNTSYIRDMEEIFTGNSFGEIGSKFTSVNLQSNLLVVRKETLFAISPNRGYRANADLFDQIFFNGQIQATEDFRDQKRWGSSETGAILQPKYNELTRYIVGTSGFPYFIMPELRSEETMFNRMEAYVMTNRLPEALADYNVFAMLRYQNGGQLTLSDITTAYGGSEQEAMMDFIIDERRKEFLGEGFRWWDIKRFQLPVVHTDVAGNTFELKAKDVKKAVQIPQGAIAQGIEPNPI